MNIKKVCNIVFPAFSGLRCLMMPYVQGDPSSLPAEYIEYTAILAALAIEPGEIGYLTIDEAVVSAGVPHRGARAKTSRAIHTEAGLIESIAGVKRSFGWGSPMNYGWGSTHTVTLDPDTQILLANNVNNSCALWDAKHHDTSLDGDIGHMANLYPYEDAVMMRAGEVYQIGILTPHESLPLSYTRRRQFLRIVGKGVHGREEYFTKNTKMGRVFA